MGIKKVTMFKTTKGEYFDTKEGAELDEKLDIMDDNIEKLMDGECWNGMSKDDVREFIYENRVELVKILN